MKKALIVSTVSRQFYLFEQKNIEVLKSFGYEVHGAANFSDSNDQFNEVDIIKHHFDIQRSPLSLNNIKAYGQLRNLMCSENFDAIHCHSPVGGVLARLAAKSVGITPVIYTAHGFHFYKGAPIINWIFYYPIEKWLARYTDIIITINREDFHRACNFGIPMVRYIPGVGIDCQKFRDTKIDKNQKRRSLGIPNNSFVILSVGELNKNKNHETILRAISKIGDQKIKYIICGKGSLIGYLEKLSEALGIRKQVKLLGYRNDIAEICKASDIFVFPSKREGLGLSALEAMASGLPIVTSNLHGIVDYSINGETGYTCNPNDVSEFADAIKHLLEDEDLRIRMGCYNAKVVKRFDSELAKVAMEIIYREGLCNDQSES